MFAGKSLKIVTDDGPTLSYRFTGNNRLSVAENDGKADALGGEDAIELSADGTAATARLHCTLTTEAAIKPSCPLVEMARAQGGGVTKRSQRGVLESVYVKVHGVWKIERSAFHAA